MGKSCIGWDGRGGEWWDGGGREGGVRGGREVRGRDGGSESHQVRGGDKKPS